MRNQNLKDAGIRFNGVKPIVRITIPTHIHGLITELIEKKRFRSVAEFMRKSAEMAVFLFYGKTIKDADLHNFITDLVENGKFSNTSQFFDWAARWKLIQLRHYPNIDHISYALKMWVKDVKS